ncbi:MAG: hypothetical protein EON59_12770, partial [Alphaproteobacteria bacterium]
MRAVRPRIGAIDLEAQRPSFGRIAKVAKALFSAPVADVVIAFNGLYWSSREAGLKDASEDSPNFIATEGDEVYWIADATA